LFFGNRHACGFPGEDLDAAGGASSITPTSVKLIACNLLAQGVDQSLAGRDLELSETFYS
jgi:hypothetical protein